MNIETPLLASDSLVCPWCGEGVSVETITCPACYLPVKDTAVDINTKADPVKQVKTAAEKKATIPAGKLPSISTHPIIIVGIDPGARYTGLSIIDGDENILLASTIVRPADEEDFIKWAKELAKMIDELIKDTPYIAIGIEGVTEPKGFKNGVRSPMNPKDILRTGVVVGALSMHYHQAIIIRPGGNGSRHDDDYPASLTGRRPVDLPGDGGSSGTRRHEKSAFDVALKTLAAIKP